MEGPAWHVVELGSKPMSEPRSEPEIIPPDRTRPEWAREGRGPRVSASFGTHRLYVGRVGPMGIVLLALLIGILAALIFVILVGAFLLWIPIAVLVFIAAIVGGLLRRQLRR
jgi:hypothetical protein